MQLAGMGLGASRQGIEATFSSAVGRRAYSLLGLAGSEAGFPAAAFAEVLSNLDEGVVANPHAGEEALDPEEALNNIIAALDAKAARIGHGTIAGSSFPGAEEVRKRLREAGVVLEVIPLINMTVRSTRFQDRELFPEHPVKVLLAAGVKVILGTDDATCYWPGHPGGAMRYIVRHLLDVGVTRRQLRSIAADSFRFCTALSEEERDHWLRRVQRWGLFNVENIPLADNHMHLAGSIPLELIKHIYENKTSSLIANGLAPAGGLSAGVPRPRSFVQNKRGVVVGPKIGDQWESLKAFQETHYQPLMTITFTNGANSVANHLLSIAESCVDHNVWAATVQAQPVAHTCPLFFADQLNIGRVRSSLEYDFRLDFNITVIRNAPVAAAHSLRAFLSTANQRASCKEMRWLLRTLCCPTGLALRSEALPDEDQVDAHPSRVPPLLTRYDVLLWVFAYGRDECIHDEPALVDVPSCVPPIMSKMRECFATYRSIAAGLSKVPEKFQTKADLRMSAEISSILAAIEACLGKHVELCLLAAMATSA